MRRKKRNLWLLIVSFLSLISIIYLIFSFPPNNIVLSTSNFQLSTVVVFFSLLFLFFFSLISYIFKSTLQGMLISSTIIAYLFLRTLGLTQPLFLILILALLFVMELIFRRNWIYFNVLKHLNLFRNWTLANNKPT